MRVKKEGSWNNHAGLISTKETSYDKLMNYHIKNGFCILTAFRTENTPAQNRELNKKLKADLRSKNLGFVTVVGGYRETITKDNPNWDKADPIQGKKEVRSFSSTESSLLVPNYNTKTKEPFGDFKELADYIISLGTKYDQDSVLISPPNGKAYYVITTDREGLAEGSRVGSIDMEFDSMGLAGIADAYFTSLTKTVGKMKAQGHGNAVKFEEYLGSYVLRPLGTIMGAHCREASGELPLFGSHLITHSTLFIESKEVKESVDHKDIEGSDFWFSFTDQEGEISKSSGKIKNPYVMFIPNVNLKLRGNDGNDANVKANIHIRLLSFDIKQIQADLEEDVRDVKFNCSMLSGHVEVTEAYPYTTEDSCTLVIDWKDIYKTRGAQDYITASTRDYEYDMEIQGMTFDIKDPVIFEILG